jgi:AAA15 family ATPase/GTPase
LKRLTTIADNRGVPSIYADIGVGRLFPLSIMGDGTKRVLALCLSFLRAEHGVLLVDEIENGLHYGVLADVWKNLGWLARQFDVQVFATTHSYECIVAANSAFTDLESDEMSLHLLYRRGGQVKVETYGKESLDTNTEYQWELRG